jgi:recombinational DNA repair protein RecR
VFVGVAHYCVQWSNNTKKMHHKELVQDLVLVDKQLQHCPHCMITTRSKQRRVSVEHFIG